MGMSVSEFLRRHSSRELTEMMLVGEHQLFPLEFMLAQLTAIVAETNRDRKRRPSAFSAADFMLNKPPRKRKTHAEIMQTMKLWQAVIKGSNA